MDKALMAFLLEMAASPRKLAEYLESREAFLDRTKLSSEAKRAILSGDVNRIAKLVAPQTFPIVFLAVGQMYFAKRKGRRPKTGGRKKKGKR